MANPEHVELVRQGAEAIAQWREENPNTWLDLSRANPHRLYLYKANLSEAELGRANLSSLRQNILALRRFW